MATQSPISTISYNSEEFLVEKLNTWIDAHIIQSWVYIKHKGEDGDKDHIHLRIEPNKRIDQMDLTEKLKEYQQGKTKPLGVRPWRPSKEEPWFLYAVHDANFLLIHGVDKGEKLPYPDTALKASEGYDLDIAMCRARASIEHTTVNLAYKLRTGSRPLDLISQGENPFVVNAMVKALSDNDYTSLSADYSDLSTKYALILEFIQNQYGVDLYFDEDLKVCSMPYKGGKK